MSSHPLGVGLLVAAVVAAAAGSIAAVTPARRWATWLPAGAAGALWVAVGVLAAAVVGLDTRFAYVADQTRDDLGPLLRLSALWAGAEGSLLLFAAMVATALVVGLRRAPVWQRFGAGSITAGLAATSLLAADPFVILDLPPLSGAGMAPILEHWAMVVHPPLLYAGMCLALIPATMRSPVSAHRWALMALAVLTVALGLGSAWAYVELGWGGWWAWDPIENVALIVWLLLAAGLHWRPLDTNRLSGSGPFNLVVIHAVCWPAVLAGAAMTRTSLRTSVHAFADAAGLAVWLWPLTVVAAVGAALRIREDARSAAEPGSTVRSAAQRAPLASRVSITPIVLLLAAAFIVAAGTYRPFIGGDGTAGWFYSRALFPSAVVGAVAIGLIPLLRRRLGRVNQLAPAVGVAGSVLAVLVGWSAWWQIALAAALASGTVLVAVGAADRRLIGVARTAGHLGMLMVLAAALGGTGSTESSIRLVNGQEADVDGHLVRLLTTEVVELDGRPEDPSGADPVRVQATVLIDGNHTLVPSVTFYPDRGLRLPEVATRTRPWLDTQVILRDVDATDGALLTVLFRPWNQLVWWGVAMLAAAAALAAVNVGRVSPSTADPSTSAPPWGGRDREGESAVDQPG